MMNRTFIKSNVVAGLAGLVVSDDAIEVAIADAIHILGNLVHYSGRSHFDEDIAYLARVLLAARKRDAA